MKAFIGRLMCCEVVFPPLLLPVASVYGVFDILDTDDRPRSVLSEESESHDGFESPDREELDHVDRNIAVQLLALDRFSAIEKF